MSVCNLPLTALRLQGHPCNHPVYSAHHKTVSVCSSQNQWKVPATGAAQFKTFNNYWCLIVRIICELHLSPISLT